MKNILSRDICGENNFVVTVNFKCIWVKNLKAVKLFDFIHSVDSKKLAKKIADEQIKIQRKIKIFIQVNIGGEEQKSGVNKNELEGLISYGKEIGLDIIGLMCIPPIDLDPLKFFIKMA